MISNSLAAALTFILTKHLHFQLPFNISYTMSPALQTPKVQNVPSFPTVFLYLNFLVLLSTSQSFCREVLVPPFISHIQFFIKKYF